MKLCCGRHCGCDYCPCCGRYLRSWIPYPYPYVPYPWYHQQPWCPPPPPRPCRPVFDAHAAVREGRAAVGGR